MLKGMAANEEDALAAFTAGDEAGLAFLFRVYYPVLVIFACKFTSNALAEEIVNEAFYKIWEKRNTINSLTHFRSYLYKIVYNACLKAKRVVNTVELPPEAADEIDYNAELIKSETLRHLYQAIETLPTQCREVFTQLYVEGKTVKETADAMGLAMSTVKAQKARGILLLRAKLGDVSLLLLSFIQLQQ